MIQEKRDSLENFLHEQLIGPGGCNYQFEVFREKEDENLKEFSIGEVVNTTPGSIYSSAILFPRQDDKEKGVFTGLEDEGTPNDPQNDDDPDSTEDEETEEEKNLDFGEDIDALGRRFPNRFGVSCCLKGEDINQDLHIRITGRFYKKVKEPLSVRIKVGNVDDLTNFINREEFKEKFGKLISIENGRIKILKTIKDSELKDYRDKLRELNIAVCKEVATNQDGSLCPIFNEASFKPEHRFLSAYKERLFSFMAKVDEDGNYACAGQEDSIKERIADVEKYETCISYIEDVFSVFNTRDFGFWQAFEFDKELDLNDIDLTSNIRVFKADDEHPALKDIVKYGIRKNVNLSLNAWLQVLHYGDKYYLKVLLENNSTAVKENEVKYFSIVTEKVNERCFFGVKVDISSPNLIPYHRENKYEANDAEANMLRFLYRDIKDYGVGHLCSVDWKKDDDGTLHVFSEFMPTIESPDVEPEPRDKKQEIEKNDGTIEAKKYLDNTQFLQFKDLSVFSNLTNEQIKNGLLDFVEKYRQWIDGLPKENDLAESNIKKCKDDYERIKRNISDFLSDDSKMLSFRLMNAAMFMQLWHNTDKNKEIVRTQNPSLTFDFYRDEADDTSIFKGVHAAWRPFQLAFILLNLDGIFQRDPNSEWKERNELVDLVWFPTGGGKTEAYLGIIALTIVNRRRTFGKNGYGTAALMRYTLRLLATQQFQRAFRLILALEQIRRWNNKEYNLGDSEISIGLYVGSGSLPNTNKDLNEEVNRWTEKDHGRIPLDTCPWCGSTIAHTFDIHRGRDVAFQCSNDSCTYGGFEIYYPVRLCDEHIYKNPPTLLFGTVDKFAQLAHKVEAATDKDSRRIFGNGHCLPPDLIIQDELHLLLGPLGSAVALYENAIDQLCSRKDGNGHIIRPKIISSTATTRNTSLQIRALYDRKVSIFPKNGVDYDDSFFAFYKRFRKEGDTDWTYIAKRKYIGILPTGRTQMTTQLRLAAILFVHRALFELDHIRQLNDDQFIKAADYYYTVISYFNSLKEVGKTDAQFYQEFTKYTRRLFKRVLRYSNMLECFYAYNTHFQKSELTGRLSGQEAVEALSVAQNLKWSPSNRLPSRNGNGSWTKAKLPADMVLATNMISVGLDVARFNTIIMNSMPRNIAEYIQASSRVARSEKGLVLTLHSPFNQRDVSHFEKFREFHEKLYYYVEPISITPFSPKSVARFLPLYLAAFIRHKYAKVSTRKDAYKIDQQLADEIKAEIKQYFRERMSRTKDTDEAALLTDDMLKGINQEIDRNIELWLTEANNIGRNLVYSIIENRYGRRNPNEISLFASPEDFEGDLPSDKWLVPNALRVIEPESVIHVIK